MVMARLLFSGSLVCCLMLVDLSLGSPWKNTGLISNIGAPIRDETHAKHLVHNSVMDADDESAQNVHESLVTKSRKKRGVPGCDSICQYWDCYVNKAFIKEQEGFETKGYVPEDKVTGQPLGNSGVTIGNGIDLGSKNAEYFRSICVQEDTISTLQPYFGLKREEAQNKLKDDPLSLQEDEAKDLSKRVMDSEICKTADVYDAAVRKLGKTDLKEFRQLTIAQRTVISSVKFQYGRTSRFPTFWDHVTNQRWDDAVSELNDFGDKYPSRREREANLLENDSGEINSCEDDPYSGLDFDTDGIKQTTLNLFSDHATYVSDLFERSKEDSRKELQKEGKTDTNILKAFSEVLWMYRVTERYGEEEAKVFGDAHVRSADISRGEKVKDLMNDKVGRNLARTNTGKSDIETVKDAMKNGDLQVKKYGEELNIVSRKDWGATNPDQWKKSKSAMLPTAYRVFIHHTAGSACTTKENCSAEVLKIQRGHIKDNNWADIGYNFLVGEDGNIYEGRGWRVRGAHTPPYNYYAYGISFLGNFEDVMPDEKAIKAARKLIDYGINKKYISEDYILRGHRDTKKTACPGETFYGDVKTWTHYTTHKKVCDVIKNRFTSVNGIEIGSTGITAALSKVFITDTGDLCNSKTEGKCVKDLASTASFFIGKGGLMYETCGWDHQTSGSNQANEGSFTIKFIGNHQTNNPQNKLFQRAMDLIECGKEKGKIKNDYTIKASDSIKRNNCEGVNKGSLYCGIKQWPKF
ncbi:uncharacterized protein LOC144443533 [Glandiceps talaboti]